MLLGGHGVISVTATVVPRMMHEMCARALAGDVKTSREMNLKLLPLHQRLFVEANPIPVKWALAQMGMIEAGVRLPMTPLAERFHEAVREALAESGIALPLRVVEKRA
jgi:4-hydroxy-tetrahydrodipicolinate synthase